MDSEDLTFVNLKKNRVRFSSSPQWQVIFIANEIFKDMTTFLASKSYHFLKVPIYSLASKSYNFLKIHIFTRIKKLQLPKNPYILSPKKVKTS